jgi:uncharacterized protein YukE
MPDLISYHHSALADGVEQMQAVNRAITEQSDGLRDETLRSASHWDTEASSVEYKRLSDRLTQQLAAASSIVANLANKVSDGSQEIRRRDQNLAQQP